MNLILRWVINSLALLGISYLLIPGISFSGFYAALITVFVLGLVNAVIRPLVLLLTLPLNIVTLGLFTFVVNGLMFWLVSTVVKGFEVSGFWAAFFGALILTVVSWIVSSFLRQDHRKQ